MNKKLLFTLLFAGIIASANVHAMQEETKKRAATAQGSVTTELTQAEILGQLKILSQGLNIYLTQMEYAKLASVPAQNIQRYRRILGFLDRYNHLLPYTIDDENIKEQLTNALISTCSVGTPTSLAQDNPENHEFVLQKQVASRLLDFGAKVNEDKSTFGALRTAVQSYKAPLVKLLIQYGADPSKCHFFPTPQDSAHPEISAEIMKIIIPRLKQPSLLTFKSVKAFMTDPAECYHLTVLMLLNGLDPKAALLHATDSFYCRNS